MKKESKSNTPALPNADTRRGKTTPSCTKLTFCTSPKVRSDIAENSHTGVSSSLVPKGNKQWFALRATYGRTKKALEVFQAANIETYLPMHRVIKKINGERKFVHEPLLPNIIFAHMTREKSHEFVKAPSPTSAWLKYYTDKTKPIESLTGLNPPITIPDNEMHNFIRLTSVNSEHIMVLPLERCHFKSGDLVRVTEGAFTGVIGKVARASGQQRIIVQLEGICNVATAYIPNDFMEKLVF